MQHQNVPKKTFFIYIYIYNNSLQVKHKEEKKNTYLQGINWKKKITWIK